MLTKKKKKCIRCESNFDYTDEDAWWDENGSASTKLVKCTCCNCVQAIKFYYSEFKDINYDMRIYDYV